MSFYFLLFMFPRTASERFHIRASRSFFTTFNPGKKLCGTLTFRGSRSHVLVPSTGTSFQRVASPPVMLLLAWSIFKTCCPGAAILHRPVLLAHSFLAVITGWPSPELCLISGSSDTGYPTLCIPCLQSSGNNMLLLWSRVPG